MYREQRKITPGPDKVTLVTGYSVGQEMSMVTLFISAVLDFGHSVLFELSFRYEIFTVMR